MTWPANLLVEIAQLQILAVLGDGIGRLAAQTQAVGQPQVRLGTARSQGDGSARGLDGLAENLLEALGLRQHGERLDMVGLAHQHDVQLADGLVDGPYIQQHAGVIGARFQVVRIDFDRLLIPGFGFLFLE